MWRIGVGEGVSALVLMAGGALDRTSTTGEGGGVLMGGVYGWLLQMATSIFPRTEDTWKRREERMMDGTEEVHERAQTSIGIGIDGPAHDNPNWNSELSRPDQTGKAATQLAGLRMGVTIGF